MSKLQSDVLEEADIETLQLLLDQAQERLRGQNALATGADARSQGVLSVSAGFAAAGLTAWFSVTRETENLLATAALIASVIWLASAICAIIAMSPRSMHAPGWPPSWIAPDIAQKKSHKKIVAEVLVQLDSMLLENRELMKRNAAFVTAAMWLLVLAAPLGVLISFVM